ncbi:beta-citrylglutamate synthase B-like [Lampetra fluviatilis]
MLGLWLLTDRRIYADYPQREIERALAQRCQRRHVPFRLVFMDDLVITVEDGRLVSLNARRCCWRGTSSTCWSCPHLVRHDAPFLFQKYVRESHGKDVRVIVVGGRVVGSMLRCATDGRMQSNCSLGGIGVMCALSEEGRRLAVQVSNILGMDVCGIDLLVRADGSYCVCEANANVGFIAFDRACGLDVAGVIADYALSLAPIGDITDITDSAAATRRRAGARLRRGRFGG